MSQHRILEKTINESKEMGLINLPKYYPKNRVKIAPEPDSNSSNVFN